jgi:hypothetical protein
MARVEHIGSDMIDYEPILRWYSGKALATMRDVTIPALRDAEARGCWPKGVARSVRASLCKQAVAARWGRENEGALRSLRTGPDLMGGDVDGFYLSHAMCFGLVGVAPHNLDLAARLRPHASPGQLLVLDEARRWAADFAPLARILELLDSRRPRPEVVFRTLSPTIVANVGKAMGMSLATIRAPKIEYTWVDWVDPDGNKRSICQGKILWPEGTRHGASRWSDGHQCNACGHAIKNPTNWFPIVADSAAGDSPASLWVGRDCARKLFGCEVTGDAIYQGREP